MSTPTPDQRRHAIAFNALTNSVAQTGRFVSLSEREQITRDVLATLDADQAVSDERYRAGLERADWLKTGEAADLIWALVHDYMAPGDIARRLHERITGEAGAVSVGDPAPAEPEPAPNIDRERVDAEFAHARLTEIMHLRFWAGRLAAARSEMGAGFDPVALLREWAAVLTAGGQVGEPLSPLEVVAAQPDMADAPAARSATTDTEEPR